VADKDGIEVAVSAFGIAIHPTNRQFLRLSPKGRTVSVSFKLSPFEQGEETIMVELYCRRVCMAVLTTTVRILGPRSHLASDMDY
jgi:hypothetical protein